MARVHRFRDAVAVSVGSGETVYMTPQQARKLARALNSTAKSCETERFIESTIGTFEVEQ